MDLWFIGNYISWEQIHETFQLLHVDVSVLVQFKKILDSNQQIIDNLRISQWSQTEDFRLLYCKLMLKSPSWTEVSEYIGSRNEIACKNRWYRKWVPLLGESPVNVSLLPLGQRIIILKENANCSSITKSDKINVHQNELIFNYKKLQSKIKEINLENTRLNHMLSSKDRTIKKLQNTNNALENQINEERNNLLEFFEEDVSQVIEHNYLQQNMRYHKRYLIEDKLFWVKQLVKGTQHYNETMRILGGPSRSTVYNWIKYDEHFKVPTIENLTDITKVKENIMFWFEQLHMETNECVSVAYDAMIFDLDLVVEEQGLKWGTFGNHKLSRPPIEYYNNPALYEQLFSQLKNEGQLIGAAFVVMILPLSHHRTFICYIYFHNNGSAPVAFINNLKTIREAVLEIGLIYCGDGFDADPS